MTKVHRDRRGGTRCTAEILIRATRRKSPSREFKVTQREDRKALKDTKDTNLNVKYFSSWTQERVKWCKENQKKNNEFLLG